MKGAYTRQPHLALLLMSMVISLFLPAHLPSLGPITLVEAQPTAAVSDDAAHLQDGDGHPGAPAPVTCHPDEVCLAVPPASGPNVDAGPSAQTRASSWLAAEVTQRQPSVMARTRPALSSPGVLRV